MVSTIGMKRYVVPNSFDPIQNGHLALLKEIKEVFGNDSEIIVAVEEDGEKNPVFSVKERMKMIKKTISAHPELQNVKVESFTGSQAGFAYENAAGLIRGVKDQDLGYDENSLETMECDELGVRLIPIEVDSNMAGIRSEYITKYQKAQMSIERIVHPYVKQCVEARISGQYILGITGSSGVGKTTICKELQGIGRERGIPVYHFNMDDVTHKIYDGTYPEPRYEIIRDEIGKEFGEHVRNPDGTINRKRLGETVFTDSEKMDLLNDIMGTPIMERLRREIYRKKGIIIIECALAAEFDLVGLTNNNIILVYTNDESQERRMKERGFDAGQIKRRLESQYTTELKITAIQNKISEYNYGKIYPIDNSDDKPQDFNKLFTALVDDLDQYGQLRFISAWYGIGADGTPHEVYSKLVEVYSQPNRFFHDMTHIVDGLNKLEKVTPLLEKPMPTIFAWFGHDYMKNDQSKIDEERSAEAWSNVARYADVKPEICDYVMDLVLATNHHDPKQVKKNDEGYIIDVDFSILGESPAKFDQYEFEIRKDYSWVDDDVYRPRRLGFLKRLLPPERPQIYCTDFFRDLYEETARANITRAIENLQSP
ncbi:MAG: dephospho-CoA kinase [Candidatus Bathyarchaeota archaeon]